MSKPAFIKHKNLNIKQEFEVQMFVVGRFVCTAGRLKVYCNAERTRYNPTHRPDTGLTRVLSELPQHHFFVFSVCLSSLQDVSGDGSVYWACSVAAPGPSSRQNYDGVSPGHFL